MTIQTTLNSAETNPEASFRNRVLQNNNTRVFNNGISAKDSYTTLNIQETTHANLHTPTQQSTRGMEY